MGCLKMANEKRLIDANAIPYEEHYVPDGDVQWEYKKEFCVLKPTIDAMHTVDAVEVVRCKDCRRCGVYTSGNLYCTHPNGLADPKPDDFCSYGERREGE